MPTSGNRSLWNSATLNAIKLWHFKPNSISQSPCELSTSLGFKPKALQSLLNLIVSILCLNPICFVTKASIVTIWPVSIRTRRSSTAGKVTLLIPSIVLSCPTHAGSRFNFNLAAICSVTHVSVLQLSHMTCTDTWVLPSLCRALPRPTHVYVRSTPALSR